MLSGKNNRGGGKMSANLEAKKIVVEEIKEKLGKAQSAVVVDYLGLTVEEATELRNRMRDADVEYKIYKNNLMGIAVEGTQFEGLKEVLKGPSAFAFGYEDAVAPARVLNGFIKEYKKMEFKAGVVEGEVYDQAGIQAIASLPGREELIAKLLGSLQSPISSFARTVQAIADQSDQAEA